MPNIARNQLTTNCRVRVKKDGVLVDATYVGWNTTYNMPDVKVGDRVMPRKIYELVPDLATSVPTLPTQVSGELVDQLPAVQVPAATSATARFTVAQRFTFLDQLVDMVAAGHSRSLLVTGPGGLGKSFTVKSRVEFAGLKADDDFKILKGYSTPKSLYRCLYENRTGLVIFDDCDSVLEHDTSVNLLKSALDSYDVRTVSWLTERTGDDLPDQFDFDGRVIFISNKSSVEIDQPILSRTLFVDLTMTSEEKILRLEMLLPQLHPNLSLDAKRECLQLIVACATKITDLNIRTLLKVINIRTASPANWRDLAEYSITS